MSFCVCHMSKFGQAAVRGIQGHNQREHDFSNTNPDIDWSMTPQNYDLHNREEISYSQTIKTRIAQLDLKRAVRKDAVVMCGIIISSDKEFFEKLTPEQTRQYFQDSYKFFSERYGSENVVASTVHMDERTPHMHFELVPVTGDGRLSAKSLFDRAELQKLQTDFHGAVGTRYLLERGVEGSKAKHIEIARMKVESAQKELEQVQQEKKRLQEQFPALQGHIDAAHGIIALEPQKTLTGAVRGLSVEDIENLKKAAAQYHKIAPELHQLRADKRNHDAEIKHLEEKSKISFQERMAHGELKGAAQKLARMASHYKDQAEELAKRCQDNGIKIDDITHDRAADQRRGMDMDMSR